MIRVMEVAELVDDDVVGDSGGAVMHYESGEATHDLREWSAGAPNARLEVRQAGLPPVFSADGAVRVRPEA